MKVFGFDDVHYNSIFQFQLHLISLIEKHEWEAVMETMLSPYLIDEVRLYPHKNPITPLHAACTIESVPTDVIHALVKLYPGACLIEDEDGSLPIHVACSVVRLTFQVILALMIACPKSCLERERMDGELPLCLLVRNNCSTNIELNNMKLLISSIPASCVYNEDTSVLHDLSSDIFPETILNQVVQMHPQVCRIQNKNDDNLLHILCSQKHSHSQTIRMVVKSNPEACTEMNSDGNLPLHLIHTGSQVKALLSHSDRDTVIRVLQTKNHNGLSPVQNFFYKMQFDLSSICSFSEGKLSTSFFNVQGSSELIDQVKSMTYLMRVYEYDSVDNIYIRKRLNYPHRLSFWTTFPLFTKMMLQHLPHLTEELDSNGELPLHVISRSISSARTFRQCLICNVYPILGPFFSYSMEGIQVCDKCSTLRCDNKSKRTTPLVEYQSKAGFYCISTLMFEIFINPHNISRLFYLSNIPLH